MKNIRFNFLAYTAIFFGTLLFSAPTGCCDTCEEDILSVSATRFTFNADDTKEEIVSVTTNVNSWSYEASAGWVALSKENDKLYISVQNYNGSEDSRWADVTVSAGAADPVSIKITQNARDNLSISPESLTFESNETGSKTASITTNALDWDARTDASWITLSKDGNTLRIGVSSENTGSSARSATITVTAGNAPPVILSVRQEALSPTNNFTATGTLTNGLTRSWTGTITPSPLTGTANTLKISKWGNEPSPVYCNYSNNKIIINSSTKAFTFEGKDYYFKAIAIDRVNGTAIIVPNYEAKYNSSTNVLDFSGYYNGYPVYVGYVCEDNNNLSIIEAISVAKLTLLRSSSAPGQIGSIAEKSSTISGPDNSGNILRIDKASPIILKKAPLLNPANSK
jgi:hypothetical protein